MAPALKTCGASAEQHAVVPFHHMLFGLFFQPRVVATLAARKIAPGQALRFLTLVCLACGIGLGLAKVPGTLRVTQDWADWFSRQVGTVWFENGRLHWAKPVNLPYTTRHRGVRIDFVPNGTAFTTDRLTGPERQGLWIEPENVRFWWRQVPNNTVAMQLMEHGKLGGVVNLERFWPAGVKLQGEQARREARRMVLHAIPLLCLREVLSLFLCVLMYAVTFSLVTFVLRSPLSANGFPSVLGFHLFASVPPLIVASVYAALDFPHLDLSTAFVCAFVVYLFVAFAWIRKADEKENEKDRSAGDMW
jgi:hypothetical protein